MGSLANYSSELEEPDPKGRQDGSAGADEPNLEGKSRKRREYKTYNYDTLPRGRGIIRLLNLYSSEKPDAGVLCELITPTEGERNRYPYEALSWCWGIAPKTCYIRIQRRQRTYAKYVSPNLVAALKALRHPDRNRYLWIDMVCIDQENLDEKNHQVEMMHAIYGNAERVCIWLGEANESSRTALRFIKEEVSHLKSFDTLCDSNNSSKKWVALLDLMQRPWFSRRWVVQELALAQSAVIYCGHDRISWKKFAIAVELLVEVETATHRLSEVMKKDRQYQYIPSYFEFVSALGASLLVDANERLFRDYQATRSLETGSALTFDGLPFSDSDGSPEASDSDDSDTNTPPSSGAEISNPMESTHRIQPLLSLEYLVSSLTIFDTSMPHDTIYALLAIAKDTTPRAVDPQAARSSGRAHDGLEIYTQRKSYNVDYNLPYVDVCKEFIMFAIDRSSRADRSRALDVICRPWAIEERQLKKIREQKQKEKIKRERNERRARDRAQRRASRPRRESTVVTTGIPSTAKPGAPTPAHAVIRNDEASINEKHIDIEDMALPSWVPQLSRAPHAMAQRPGYAGPKMSRINADPLVGLPSLTQRNYSAAETKGVDMKSLKFRKRATLGHFSMYVRGFELDRIQEVEQVARNGQIPREWAELGRWECAKDHPPEAFWRTLVANRGKEGKNPPVYYSRACEESFRKGGVESGAVDTTALIEYERNSVVAQFCRRVQAVTWNRALVKTEAGKLGLVRKDVERGDRVCILYGCSVPVILRKSGRKEEDIFVKELEHELLYVKNTVVQSFLLYAKRKKRHEQQKRRGMKQLCRQWFKNTDWIRANGITRRQLTNGEITEKLRQILETAVRDFGTWRCREREKMWRRIEQEKKEVQIVKPTPDKQQVDELRRKRKALDEQKTQEFQVQRKRRKSRAAFGQTPLPALITVTDGTAIGISKDASASVKKNKSLVDWWEFEYALAAGRQWKRVVQKRKEERAKSALTETYEDWGLKKREEFQEFERKRRIEGTWKNPPGSTNEAPGVDEEDEEVPGVTNEPTDRSKATRTPGICSGSGVRASWIVKANKEELTPEQKDQYNAKIRKNLCDRLGKDGYFSYELLGECYIHGMMDGEAMLYQNEGAEPSMVFEIR